MQFFPHSRNLIHSINHSLAERGTYTDIAHRDGVELDNLLMNNFVLFFSLSHIFFIHSLLVVVLIKWSDVTQGNCARISYLLCSVHTFIFFLCRSRRWSLNIYREQLWARNNRIYPSEFASLLICSRRYILCVRVYIYIYFICSLVLAILDCCLSVYYFFVLMI